MKKVNVYGVLAGLLIGFFLIIFFSGCTVIGPGERGVRVTLGSASNDIKEPGAYLWIPFVMGMAELNVQIQKSEVKTSAASKDMQEITTDVAINWSITPDQVVNVYKTIGYEDDVLKRVISPAVSEVLKSAAAKKTAEEILTKRMDLKNEIDEQLKTRLSHYGVSISDVSITNLAFSHEFTQAIERKQIAEQRAKESEYEAQKAIQTAKAEVNSAKGQAEAQNLMKQTITKELLQLKAIEKWNGQFPTYMGSGSVPFINMGGQ